MATTTTVGQLPNNTVSERRFANKTFYWLLGLALIIILTVGYTMSRNRDISTPTTNTERAAPSNIGDPAPNSISTDPKNMDKLPPATEQVNPAPTNGVPPQ